MINVLIADDHRIVREALQRLLEMEGDMQIVAIAADGQEAVEQAVLHCPNVAVMDLSMPVLNGIEATKQICARGLETRVLILSMYDTPYYVHSSMQAGASGYVLKDVACDELVIAIRTVFQGNRYFSKPITKVAKYFIQSHEPGRPSREVRWEP